MSLPNLHPALVHFPVALLPMAVLFDVVGAVSQSQRIWLNRAATSLYAVAAVATAAAYWTGRRAADTLVGLAPQQQFAVGEHNDAALIAPWLVGIFAMTRVAIGLRVESRRSFLFRALLLPVALASVVYVFIAADLGGGLVFQHGIAVQESDSHEQLTKDAIEAKPIESVAKVTEIDVESRLERLEDGSIVWEPLASDGQALGQVLDAAEGSSLEAVRWEQPGVGVEKGLGLRVSGRSILVLPGEVGDVQVEAEIDAGRFVGTLGLAHHVRSVDKAGFHLVSTESGEARLTAVVRGEESEMARGEVLVESGTLQLAAFAAGRHFRGMQKGEVVVHGHRDPLEPGKCGIYLDGQGVVRILSIRVTPIVD